MTANDGWRGQPLQGFSDLDVFSAALELFSRGLLGHRIAAAYDGRAGSQALCELTGRLLAAAGADVVLADAPCPTPAVAHYLEAHPEVDSAIILTASHNPPGYFGIKVRLRHDQVPEDFTPDTTPARQRDITRRLAVLSPASLPTVHLARPYVDLVVRPFLDACGSFDGLVHLDCAWGAVGACSPPGGPAGPVEWVRAVPLPFFLGAVPDPSRTADLVELATTILRLSGRSLLLATDGDGDRLSLLTKGSGYISIVEAAALLLLHALPAGVQVVSTIVTPAFLGQVTASTGGGYQEVDVGFKHIAARRPAGPAACLGVEPNGGFALVWSDRDLFERDGLAAAALLLTHYHSTDELDAAVADLRRRWPSWYRIATLAREPEQVADDLDAVLDDRWQQTEVGPGITRLTDPASGQRITVRPSSTERRTRVYVDLRDPDQRLWALLGFDTDTPAA